MFASTGGGDWYFWDTEDGRDAARREYGVYYHAREYSGDKIKLVAPSFESFVTEICLGPQYPHDRDEPRPLTWTIDESGERIPLDDEPWEIEWNYCPAWQSET